MNISGPQYFGTSILVMGKWINWAQVVGYISRVSLMSIGFMVFAFLLTVGFDIGEAFKVLNQFTATIEKGGDETVIRVGWVLFGAFLVCFGVFFFIGWKKFKEGIDGDRVARDLFVDMNTTIMEEEALS